MSVGLVGAGACLAGAAMTDSAAGQATLLVMAGASGASVSTASGRAVMTWFTGERRGVAMGIRQCAVPAGSGLAALALPPLVDAHGVPAAYVALSATCLLAATAVVIVVKEPPQPASALAPAPA
nr:MFS transporter [Micromonospora sp. DSM 115978]